MVLRSIKEADVKNKKVLVRIDINSPIVKNKVLDSPRFKESSETIKYLLKRGAKVAIIAHQGRKDDGDFLQLQQHAKILSKYVGKKIEYVNDLFGRKAVSSTLHLKNGEAILLSNVRNYPDESDINNSNNRYKELCSNFDIYVNDAFSVSHRKQGSVILPPKYLQSYMGLAMQKEISALKNFEIKNKPTIYLIGGSKIDDYLPIFNKLKNKKSKMIVSGVFANLILVANGYNLGYENKWLRDEGYLKMLPYVKQLYKRYKKQIITPIDFAFDIRGRREFALEKSPFRYKIWDVGHATIKLYKQELRGSKAIFMKGPLGFSEIPQFGYGTVEILKEVSKLSKNKRVFSLLGGGHLTTTLTEYKVPDNFSYISMSGGALMTYISGGKLPGLEALNK